MSSRLKTVAVILSIILSAIGAGVLYDGYYRSLTEVTYTDFVTTTKVSLTTIVEPSTSTVTEMDWVLKEQTVTIQAASSLEYCGHIDYLSVTLLAGFVHLTFHTEKSRTSFWLLNEQQFEQFRKLYACDEIQVSWNWNNFVAQMSDVTHFEYSTDLSAEGTYYFLFLNVNHFPISITLSVDQGVRQHAVTSYSSHTSYLTQTVSVPTVTTAMVPTMKNLEEEMFGVILVAIGGFAIVCLKWGPRKSSRPKSVTRFCIDCGAENDITNERCSKCGQKLIK